MFAFPFCSVQESCARHERRVPRLIASASAEEAADCLVALARARARKALSKSLDILPPDSSAAGMSRMGVPVGAGW